MRSDDRGEEGSDKHPLNNVEAGEIHVGAGKIGIEVEGVPMPTHIHELGDIYF